MQAPDPVDRSAIAIAGVAPAGAGAVWGREGGGRIAVLGSAAMLGDTWLEREDNSRIMDFLFRWLRPVSPCGPLAVMGNLHCWFSGELPVPLAPPRNPLVLAAPLAVMGTSLLIF